MNYIALESGKPGDRDHFFKLIYNPYNLKPNEVKKVWILPEFWKTTRAYIYDHLKKYQK